MGSAWIPTILLFGMTLHARARSGSWFAPSAFIGLVWCFFISASLLGVDRTVPALGIWVIVALVLSIQLGSAVAEGGSSASARARPDETLLVHWLPLRIRSVCFLMVLIASAGCVYFVRESMERFGLSLTVTDLVQMAARWTLERYDEIAEPLSLRFTAIWLYPGALLGGMLFSLSKKPLDRALGLFSLLPTLIYSLLTGGRASFLVGLACWLGGYWSSRHAQTRGGLKLFTAKIGASVLVLMAGLFLLFLVVNSFRGYSSSKDLYLEVDSGQVRNYMLGSPAAFADWIAHTDYSSLHWGGYTFAGLYNLLGIQQRILGDYKDSARTSGLEGTNVFTAFRGLIQDFTFPGALFICGAWGLFSGYAYSKKSFHPWSLLGLSAFYAVGLFSPLYCLFRFNGAIFAWVVSWFVLRPMKEGTAFSLRAKSQLVQAS